MRGDGEARGRLTALRASEPVAPPAPEAADVDGRRLGIGDDLRSRALEAAARAYTAAHGHPVDRSGWADRVPSHAHQRPRWSLDRRSAAAVLGVLGVLLLVLAARGPSWGEAAAHGSDRAAARPGQVVPGATGETPGGSDVPATPGPPPLGDGRADATASSPADGPSVPELLVHVVGEVGRPGLVRLPAGARVADALEAAGGATGAADLSAVNLARPVSDGEQVHVPAPGEPVLPGAGVQATSDAPGQVDVNRAGAGELDALPGIGPVLADRIVAWRDTHGRFSTIDELAEVSGIGPRLLERLREHVVVG